MIKLLTNREMELLRLLLTFTDEATVKKTLSFDIDDDDWAEAQEVVSGQQGD